jgi:tetratricopeptide (TPR) repeat protein
MQQTLNTLWNEGQALESKRDQAGARAKYEAIVAIDAHHIAAQLRLSRFAQFADEYRLARRHVLDAADAIRAGASTKLLGFVTQRLLDFSEDNEVAALILSTDWSDPEVLRQSPVLAQHLWLCGRYQDALRFLDTAETKLPPNALLAFTRASVLRYLGRMDEALVQYERAIALDPELADVHWALSTHARDPQPPHRLERIQQVATRHQAENLDIAHLHYARFRELDYLDKREQAWDALRAGARIMQLATRHSADEDRACLKRLQALGCEPVPHTVRRAEQPIPIFIVGLPRTGTTLLDRILGNHGWVSSAGERNDFSAAVSDVSNHFFSTLLREDDPAAFMDIDLEKAGQLYQQRLKRHVSATAFAIDKNPQNLFNVPLIVRALPHARVLILEREPMDAAFSNLKELFQGGAYAYSYDDVSLATRIYGARQLMHGWQSQNPGAIRVVSYEQLVQSPDTVVMGMLAFLSLPPAQGLTDMKANDTAVATASSAQVREPINTRGIGAWRRYAEQLEPLRRLLDGET